MVIQRNLSLIVDVPYVCGSQCCLIAQCQGTWCYAIFSWSVIIEALRRDISDVFQTEYA